MSKPKEKKPTRGVFKLKCPNCKKPMRKLSFGWGDHCINRKCKDRNIHVYKEKEAQESAA